MHDTAYILDGDSAVERVTILSRERDGFTFARTTTGVTLRLAPSELHRTAYLAGIAAGPRRGMRPWSDLADFASAAASWKGAQHDHGHTSYYGALVIREYRAYWLGRLRAIRNA